MLGGCWLILFVRVCWCVVCLFMFVGIMLLVWFGVRVICVGFVEVMCDVCWLQAC